MTINGNQGTPFLKEDGSGFTVLDVRVGSFSFMRGSNIDWEFGWSLYFGLEYVFNVSEMFGQCVFFQGFGVAVVVSGLCLRVALKALLAWSAICEFSWQGYVQDLGPYAVLLRRARVHDFRQMRWRCEFQIYIIIRICQSRSRFPRLNSVVLIVLCAPSNCALNVNVARAALMQSLILRKSYWIFLFLKG